MKVTVVVRTPGSTAKDSFQYIMTTPPPAKSIMWGPIDTAIRVQIQKKLGFLKVEEKREGANRFQLVVHPILFSSESELRIVYFYLP